MTDHDSWTCQICGTANFPRESSCAGGCGFVRRKKLKLMGTDSREVILTFDVDFGRIALRHLIGEDSKFASHSQCRFIQKDDGWYILPLSQATHPTCINGDAVTSEKNLKTGDHFSIGVTRAGLTIEIL